MSVSTRTPPPVKDNTWMEESQRDDRIVVSGVYLTNFANPYIPMLYGCGLVSE